MHYFKLGITLSALQLYLDTVSGTRPGCNSFAQTLDLCDLQATVLSSQLLTKGETINLSGDQALYCQNTTTALVDTCRIAFNIVTSARSSVYAEVWLPVNNGLDWSGRMMSTGNPGFSGCIEYDNVAYATSLGFAAVGDNGGHNSTLLDGTAFLNNDDAIVDFSYRARHASTVLGKEVCQRYYGQKMKKAYHFGCSNAGRQGHKMAQMYPEDFDGILSGAPALDWNHLTSWGGHFLTLTGTNSSDPRFLTRDQWAAVHDEVLNQCDLIDGVRDDILEDSSICPFNPEELLCDFSSNTTDPSSCLTLLQVQTVRAVFTPLYGLNNKFIYPRFSPSAELTAATPLLFPYLIGDLNNLGAVWYQNAVYNDPTWDPTSLNALDFEYADRLDSRHGYISSYSGDLSAFKSRGGKIITYHGGTDSIIPDGISFRYYRHLASTMGLSSQEIDDFYRLFPISGMEHCLFGLGAWAFGQESPAANAGYNVVMALVDWVENGKAPDRITGTKWKDDDSVTGIVELERAHCRYPYRTTYQGYGNPNKTDSWTCTFIDGWDICGGPSDRLPQLC